ncbi:accessory Sec system S-layer assembly protein [Bacillus sp. OV194]|uniref:accessory Sec system S-layer assembly protein n=1 Tax=Fictibacillus sp. B-59209 TaxID=3024873 RepID=UPI0008F37092|nr:accessory Sec system S-layer assembly protein [Fictibacillus sp. B-59209]MED2970917.1 accessory Sec system S-layer assembly protein [Fictibacillus sp. B-59209]SFD40944.1 accessory Sec system S-layer assembly protein [Bacillus sp. OV194]
MLSFFKKSTNSKDTNEASVAVVEPVQDTDASQEPVAEEAETVLHIHPEWDITVQERYVYQFHHAQLPKLKPNQISISKIDVVSDDDSFMVNAFIRNTLSKSIRFEEVTLLLLDTEGTVFARKTFDLELMGDLPANTCQPWIFLFSEEDLLGNGFPAEEEWRIAFELKKKAPSEHQLMLHESWENSLNDMQKTRLYEMVNNLPPLTAGEINFMGIEARIGENSDLSVTLLIRNGSDKDIKVEQLPLCFEDASGELTAKGAFQLTDFEVKANTSKPWTFIFPEALLLNKTPDLSAWKVYPPQS